MPYVVCYTDPRNHSQQFQTFGFKAEALKFIEIYKKRYELPIHLFMSGRDTDVVPEFTKRSKKIVIETVSNETGVSVSKSNTIYRFDKKGGVTTANGNQYWIDPIDNTVFLMVPRKRPIPKQRTPFGKWLLAQYRLHFPKS